MEVYNESKIGNYPDIINYECSKKIIKQMEKCVCKIKLDKENKEKTDIQGTGFFCKIPFPDRNNLLSVLITNNHIINDELLNKPNFNIKIFIKEEIDIEEICLNNRIKYTNEKYDTTIIEIKESDKINNYLELNDIIIDNIINNEKRNKDFIDQTIYIMHYPGGKLSVSYGIFESIYEEKEQCNFSHLCNTLNGSSGSPLLSLNNKVIGIHKQGIIKHNLGTLLDYPLKDFIKLYFNADNSNNNISTTLNIEDYTTLKLSKNSDNISIAPNKLNDKNLIYILKKENRHSKKIISKEIICPECKENILIDIYNFKINLYECKNYHIFNNILINKFYDTQIIDIYAIKCNLCNKDISYDKDYYICNTCNKNLCESCKSKHDKTHIVINFEDKNYICKKHNESFFKYCKKCNEDLCIYCENEHKSHNIYDFKKILVLINKNKLIKKLEELKNIIDKYKELINIMKKILDKTTNMIDLYYKINKDYINNYDIKKRNYHKLLNLFNLNHNNEILIDDLNTIIKNDKFSDVFEFAYEKFYTENGEKYFGELKNNLKEGKGILYYSTKDEKDIKKYIGDFQNDKKDGKGINYWNNGNRYEGEYKNGKREGKGIFYYNNGDRYEGNFFNDMYEGKGKYIFNHGDEYCGDWKNDKKEGWGIYKWKNGDIFEGEWKNDIREGNGIKNYQNIGKYDGEWKNEKKEGKGIMYYINGDRFEGVWKNGIRDGIGIMYYKFGKVEKGYWKNDICKKID